MPRSTKWECYCWAKIILGSGRQGCGGRFLPGFDDAWISLAAEPVLPADKVEVVLSVRWIGVFPNIPFTRGIVTEPLDTPPSLPSSESVPSFRPSAAAASLIVLLRDLNPELLSQLSWCRSLPAAPISRLPAEWRCGGFGGFLRPEIVAICYQTLNHI